MSGEPDLSCAECGRETYERSLNGLCERCVEWCGVNGCENEAQPGWDVCGDECAAIAEATTDSGP